METTPTPVPEPETFSEGDEVFQARPSGWPELALVPGTHLAVQRGADGTVVLVDLDTGEVRARRRVPSLDERARSASIVLDATGRYAAISSVGRYASNPRLHLWDLAQDRLIGLELEPMLARYGPEAVAVAPGAVEVAYVEIALESEPESEPSVVSETDPSTGRTVQRVGRTSLPKARIVRLDPRTGARRVVALDDRDDVDLFRYEPDGRTLVIVTRPRDDSRYWSSDRAERAAVPHRTRRLGEDGRLVSVERTSRVPVFRPDGSRVLVSEGTTWVERTTLDAADGATLPFPGSASVSFSADGRCIVSHDVDGSLLLVASATREIRARFSEASAISVAAVGDCERALILRTDGTLAIVDAPFTAAPRVLGSSGDPVRSRADDRVEASQDGQLAITRLAGRALLFDLVAQQQRSGGADVFAIVPDRLLWSSTGDALLALSERGGFEVDAGGLHPIACQVSAGALALSNGGFAVYGSDPGANMITVRDRAGRYLDHCRVEPPGLSLRPRERLVAIEASGAVAFVVDREAFWLVRRDGSRRRVDLRRTLPCDDEPAYCPFAAEFDATGARLVVVSRDRVAVIDVSSGRVVQHHPFEGGLGGIAFGSGPTSLLLQRDSSSVTLLASGRGGVRTLEAAEGEELILVSSSGFAYVVHIGPALTHLQVEEPDGMARNPLLALDLDAQDDAFRSSIDVFEVRGGPAFVVSSEHGFRRLVDLPGRRTLPVPGELLAVARAEGRAVDRMLVCGEDGELRMLGYSQAEDPSVLATLGRCDGISLARIAPNGRAVALVRDGTVELRSVARPDTPILLGGRVGEEVEVLGRDAEGRVFSSAARTQYLHRAPGDARTAPLGPPTFRGDFVPGTLAPFFSEASAP
ncbi:MAG: hypothetical protein U0230_14195 [Polyangiales bacterium]